MKVFFLATLLFSLFTSCAHKGVRTQLASNEQDSLHEESFMRYGHNRFQEVQSDDNQLLSQLKNCYQEKIPEALNHLKSVLKESENNPYYWIVMANCYLLDKNSKKAEFYYDKALKLRPKKALTALVKNNLGLIELKNRNYDRAYKLFNTALENSPQSITPKFNMAQVHIQFGHLDKAQRTLLILEKKAPEDIDVLASLGAISLLKGKNKRAIHYFERIPERYRKRQDTAVNYALALYQDQRFEQARAFMLKVGLITSKYLRDIERNLSSRIDEKLNQ